MHACQKVVAAVANMAAGRVRARRHHTWGWAVSSVRRRLRKSIVAVITDVHGQRCGAGFLVGADLVCTCTHVVRRALDPRGSGAPPEPGATVEVVFPYLGWLSVTATALSAAERADGDIAILQLDSAVPPTVERVRWATGQPLSGHRFDTVGFPPGNGEGAWVHGYVSGPRTDQSFQLNVDEFAGYCVQPGFSGAPVWCAHSGGVLGMIRDHHANAATATLSPTFAGTVRLTFPTNVAAMVGAAQLREHLLTHVPDRVPELSAKSDPVSILTAGLAGHRRDSVQQFLHQYLGTVAVPAPFGGRDAEMAALDHWLGDDACPFAVMAARAGRGKSALVTRWAARLARSATTDVIVVPISIRFDTALSPAAISILGARLRHIDADPSELPTDANTWVSTISDGLREDRPPGRRLVVIIDGADEAADWELGRDLKFVDVGAGVKILLVARHAGGRDSPGWAKTMCWPGATHLDIGLLTDEQVGEAVMSMGPALAPVAADPDVLAELTRLCEGDPLIVGLWLSTLFERAQHGQHLLTAEDLQSIPPGLTGLFTDWCDYQRTQWQAAGGDPDLIEKQVIDFLHVCALALGPLTLDDVAELGEGTWSSTDLRRISVYTARFITGDGAEQGWVFSHPLLAEFFCSERRMSRRERANWEGRFLRLGRHTLTQLNAAAPASLQRPYALRCYGAHLTRAAIAAPAVGLDPDMVSLRRFTELITPAWLSAITTVTGTHEGFVADLDRACGRADQCIEQALATSDTTSLGHILAEQIRLALVRASLHSVTANVPGAIVVGLLTTGAWSPRQAMTFSQRMVPDEQVEVLTAVLAHAPELTEEVLAAALRLAESPARLQLLAAVGAHDPARREQLATEALAMFVRACPQRQTADAVNAVLPLLERAQLSELVDQIETLGHPEGRANALLALAEAHPRDQRRHLLSRAARAATALPDGESSCELLVRVARLAADDDQRAEALTAAHTRARAGRFADRKVAYLLEIYTLAPSEVRSHVQRDILAAIDTQQLSFTSANQHLCRLVARADSAQLDELAEWVSSAYSPTFTRSDYTIRSFAQFLCRLAARLDAPRSHPIRIRALSALGNNPGSRLVCDEERAVVSLLAQLPDDQCGPWRRLQDNVSVLGQLEPALTDPDQRAHLNLDEVSALLTRTLTEPGGDLDRVLSYAPYLPASCLLTPLVAAADAGARYSWHALPAALPHLLASAAPHGDTLDADHSAAFIRLISQLTGPSRFYPFALIAPHLGAQALGQVLDLQMRITDTTTQDQLLITLATHMNPTARARWTPKILNRMGLPVPGTETTGYRDRAAALLPLLDAEQTTALADAIARDVDVSAHRSRELCEVLYRLCELGRAETAVALLTGDPQRFMIEDLAIKVAALAANNPARPDLDAAVLALVGEGPSRLRRLLALPEGWRRRHHTILETDVARCHSAGGFDGTRRCDIEMTAAALPYLTDPDAHQSSLHTMLDTLTALTDPNDRIETLAILLGGPDQPPCPRVIALARHTLTETLDTHHRRRLLCAMAPHLDPGTLTKLILAEFDGDYLFEPALTAMIDRLDAAEVRHIYATAAGHAHTSGGFDDILRAPVVIMIKGLIRLAELGCVDETLSLLQRPPADTAPIAQFVLEAIAAHLQHRHLSVADQLVNPPGGFHGHPMSIAPLLLRRAYFTGALPLLDQLAGPTPTYFSGNILPGLTQRLLEEPAAPQYRPLGKVLVKCSRRGHRSLLNDLAVLTPLVAHLGTTAALEATADAVVDVSHWFA